MKITCLMENTTACSDILAEHGLSLYIETGKKHILFDTGQTGAFAQNAKTLGIDLSKVDFAVLSHGHYDHGGGLKTFLELNHKAPVYVNRSAFLPHYNGTEKYIGLDVSLASSKQIVYVEDALQIDNTCALCTCNGQNTVTPINSFGLNKIEQDTFVPDDFLHEQYLEITEHGKTYLISGCSHKGILNIMHWFSPDVLIGGFHFMKLDPEKDGAVALKQAANQLKTYKTIYYTCHCTGVPQYEFLKKEMGDQIFYLSAGKTIEF